MRSHARTLCVVALLVSGCSRSFPAPKALPAPSAGGYISGKVIRLAAGAPTGVPEPGVKVHPAASSAAVTTDTQGLFTLGPLPAGSYRLLFELTDAQGDHRKLLDGIQVVDGATAALGEVVLRENAQVAGNVSLAGQARGNAGAVAFVSGLPFSVTTADDGSYLLRNLPEGAVAVTAFHSGYASASTPVMDLQGGVVTTAQLLLLPPATAAAQPGSISGTVHLVSGGAASGAQVSARALGQDGGAEAIADGQGSFTLGGLAPDLWTVRVELAGYVPVEIPNLLVTAGSSERLPDAVVLAPGAAPVDAGPADAGPLDAGAADAGTGTPCTFDSDCAGGRLCVQGFCAACHGDAECKPGYLCRALDCVLACGVNSDCAAGEVCNSGACGPCASSASCTGGLVCVSGACVVCGSSADCPAGQICGPTGCGPCGDTSQCPVGEVCAAGACGPCSSLAPCPSGQVCDQGACAVGTCATASDCQSGGSYSGQVCVDHGCTSCTTALTDGGFAACAPGTLCDGASGLCVPGNCSVDTDCAGTAACVNHLCTGNCRTSADCRGVNGACTASHVCGACLTNAECGAGYVCTSSGQCLVGQCARSADCPGGQTCNAQLQCVALTTCGPDAGACATGEQCWAGSCYACDGTTQSCCSKTADCLGGNFCDLGVCRPNPVNTWTLSQVMGDYAPYAGIAAGDDGTLYVPTDIVNQAGKLTALYPDGGTAWGPIVPTGHQFGTGSRTPTVVRYPGASQDEVIYQDLGGGQAVVRVSPDDGGTLLATGDAQRTDGTNPALGLVDGGLMLFTIGHYDYNGYGGWMVALDAATMQTRWAANLNCAQHQTNDHTLVGTEGTVYAICIDATLQAWDPAGTSGGVGRQLWVRPAPGWYSYFHNPVIARPAGEAQDSVFLIRGYNGYSSVVKQPVSASGYGASIESPSLGQAAPVGLAVLDDGWLLVPLYNGVVLVSPDLQTVRGGDGPPGGISGQYGWSVSDDKVFYAVYGGMLCAWRITPDHQLKLLWTTWAPGGSSMTNGAVTLVPSAGSLEAVVDTPLLGASYRSLTAFQLPTGRGVLAGPWTTNGGTNHRTYSLQVR